MSAVERVRRAAGTAALDAVRLPEDWISRGRVAERQKARLVWNRWYDVPLTKAETVAVVDRLFTEAGWTRSDDCLGSDGEKCFTYYKDDYYLSPGITHSVCDDGGAGCAYMFMTMRLT
jgi:hypothetical protein